MGVVNEIIKDVPIPRMVKIKQSFERTCLEDISGEVLKQLNVEKVKEQLRPGDKIAVAVGSRGIYQHALVVKTVVDFLKTCGTEPFIVAAMGSHGGATVEGQKSILDGYGITEEYCGCPVKIGKESWLIGQTEDGNPVYIDQYAAKADGIVIINRIKPHTAFRGPYESGPMKMLAIGLGKQKGAEACHLAGFENMAENIPKFGRAVLKNAKILFGVALLENAYDRTREIVVLTGNEIEKEEPELLERAKSYMPKILIEHADLLIVEQIGKNFSGDGMDPNIAGTFATKCASGGLDTQRVAVLDISDESHGNGVGFGMADVSTQRAYKKFDFEMSYPNALTCLVSQVVKVPMIFDTDKNCIKAGIKLCANINYSDARVILIYNTLRMDEMYISESLLEQASFTEGIEIIGHPEQMVFDDMGNLVSMKEE